MIPASTRWRNLGAAAGAVTAALFTIFDLYQWALAYAGDRFHNGAAGQPALRVSFVSPRDVTVTPGAATVNAPGAPGSIEKGTEERRGYMLRAVAPAAKTFRFEVTLDVVDHS